MPGLSDADHFALIRNFRRHAFLLLFLFGASPALCRSFVEGRDHGLVPLGEGSLYQPHATSLRMGRLGYQSDAQASIHASFNSLESYAASLHDALTRPYPAYQAVGVHNLGGEYNQLATTLLQIENEFYGTIRPKRTIRAGERPLHALRERGVEYIEVRCMDLDPFEPLGINASTMHFIDMFLLHCAVSDSPPDTPDEIAALGRNQHRTASHGREPGLRLERGGAEVTLIEWAEELLQAFKPLAMRLDAAFGGTAYGEALLEAEQRLARPDTTPSARALQVMQADFDRSFAAFVLAQSVQTRAALLALPLGAEQAQAFQAEAAASVAQQRAIEKADSGDFEAFRQAYLAPERLLLAAA